MALSAWSLRTWMIFDQAAPRRALERNEKIRIMPPGWPPPARREPCLLRRRTWTPAPRLSPAAQLRHLVEPRDQRHGRMFGATSGTSDARGRYRSGCGYGMSRWMCLLVALPAEAE